MSQPFEMFESQDVNDDDGQVIDDLFKEVDQAPNLRDAVQPIVVPAKPAIKIPTRLLTGSMTLDPTWAPVMLLPADAERTGIYFRVYSPTSVATDGVRIADESGKCAYAGRILSGGDGPFSDHTGAVWVLSTGATGTGAASAPVTIEYWSVTK